MRATAFSLLTPFCFLKAGSLVSLPAILAGAGLIGLFLAVKVGAKVIGVWPTARAFGLPARDANYTTLLMSTGLTFGTIAMTRVRGRAGRRPSLFRHAWESYPGRFEDMNARDEPAPPAG
jgi:Kef-type K+ transport system membrane component KefB